MSLRVFKKTERRDTYHKAGRLPKKKKEYGRFVRTPFVVFAVCKTCFIVGIQSSFFVTFAEKC